MRSHIGAVEGPATCENVLGSGGGGDPILCSAGDRYAGLVVTHVECAACSVCRRRGDMEGLERFPRHASVVFTDAKFELAGFRRMYPPTLQFWLQWH